MWAVHFIKQLLSVIFWLVSLVLGNFSGEAHFSKWKTLQGLEFERDLWPAAWSEREKNKTEETLSAWPSFHLFSYSVAYHAVSPALFTAFCIWLLYLHSREVSTLWEVKEICLIRLTNHEIIIFNTPQEAKQNVESHAEVQPPLLIEDIEAQVGQKITNQNCCTPLFPLRNIFIFITLVPGCSAVN